MTRAAAETILRQVRQHHQPSPVAIITPCKFHSVTLHEVTMEAAQRMAQCTGCATVINSKCSGCGNAWPCSTIAITGAEPLFSNFKEQGD